MKKVNIILIVIVLFVTIDFFAGQRIKLKGTIIEHQQELDFYKHQEFVNTKIDLGNQIINIATTQRYANNNVINDTITLYTVEGFLTSYSYKKFRLER